MGSENTQDLVPKAVCSDIRLLMDIRLIASEAGCLLFTCGFFSLLRELVDIALDLPFQLLGLAPRHDLVRGVRDSFILHELGWSSLDDPITMDERNIVESVMLTTSV